MSDIINAFKNKIGNTPNNVVEVDDKNIKAFVPKRDYGEFTYYGVDFYVNPDIYKHIGYHND